MFLYNYDIVSIMWKAGQTELLSYCMKHLGQKYNVKEA